jgi:hypothetical protein
MRRTGLWWAAALVVASNLGAWGFAALNRSGEPEAVFELTERELRLPAKQADNTALTLELVFDLPRPAGLRRPPREPGWFDRAKLQSIGFDCSTPVTMDNAQRYRTRPPRTTYAVLEYEGEAWRRQMAEPLPEAAPPPAQGATSVKPAAAEAEGTAGAQPPEATSRDGQDRLRQSHLVVIDVGNDRARLREQYPDRRRVAIVEATAELQFVNNPGQAPFLAGRVMSVLPGEINVPREWLTLLEGLQTERNTTTLPPPLHDPRYRVTVKWGRNLEPWIADVQLIATVPPR